MASLNELISQGYGGYAGWGENEALADYKATGGSGKYTGGSQSGGQSGVSSFNDYVTQAQNMYKPAIEPAVNPYKHQYLKSNHLYRVKHNYLPINTIH